MMISSIAGCVSGELSLCLRRDESICVKVVWAELLHCFSRCVFSRDVVASMHLRRSRLLTHISSGLSEGMTDDIDTGCNHEKKAWRYTGRLCKFTEEQDKQGENKLKLYVAISCMGAIPHHDHIRYIRDVCLILYIKYTKVNLLTTTSSDPRRYRKALRAWCTITWQYVMWWYIIDEHRMDGIRNGRGEMKKVGNRSLVTCPFDSRLENDGVLKKGNGLSFLSSLSHYHGWGRQWRRRGLRTTCMGISYSVRTCAWRMWDVSYVTYYGSK